MARTLLVGGRSTEYVYLEGDVVYRPHKPCSKIFGPLLRYFESKGIPYTHRYLGVDDSGHDMFSYIPGEVPIEVGSTTQDQLEDFMRIVRILHDASSTYLGDNGQVMCHGDLSPCNVVFHDDRPIAVIDWDSASPAPRWHDLAYIIWTWVNIGKPDIDIGYMLECIAGSLSSYSVTEADAIGFSSKLIERMELHRAGFDPNRSDYARSMDWIDFSENRIREHSVTIDEAAYRAVHMDSQRNIQ